MEHASREYVKRKYARSGREYDQVRLEDPRGRLLSDHDLHIFLDMLPEWNEQWSVLEVGAGTGRFTIPALDRGYRLIATDINETMLEQLRIKVAESGFEDRCDVRSADIFNLEFPEAHFDFVFSFHVIPRFVTLDDQRAAIIEVGRTLKPGGRFLFNYRNRKSLLFGRLHRGHAATPAQIEEMLAEAGMRMTRRRGKWLLNRSLLNRTPLFAGRFAARLDRRLLDFRPDRAWDVFVEAVKDAG